MEQGIAFEDVVIDLGYRRADSDETKSLTPMAGITRDGTPGANAMVFCRLTDSDEAGVELATVYDSEGDSAWYASTPLQVNTLPCVISFRIVLPDQPEAFLGEITVPPTETK